MVLFASLVELYGSTFGLARVGASTRILVPVGRYRLPLGRHCEYSRTLVVRRVLYQCQKIVDIMSMMREGLRGWS